MRAIFDTKPTSIYDDEIARHYQFPKRYMSIVERCAGDWVILRRPRADGGNLAYFAAAHIAVVEPDRNAPGRSFARFDDFMPFDHPVSWTTDGRYAEEALRNTPLTQVGLYLRGRSVRAISDADFIDLVSAGLRDTLDPRNAYRLGISTNIVEEANNDLNSPPAGERDRRVEKVLTNRIIRDASFRRLVCEAYDNRCAVTGLRIIDSGGRAEAQAAHIWAVADGGPDVVQNGIALSATVHWLFDRHLISLSDDHRLLVAGQSVPSEFQALFAQNGERVFLPTRAKDWPHPSYIGKHREIFQAKARSAE